MRQLLFFLLLSLSLLHAKEVLIITPAFNKPQFIGWQKQLFDKYVLDDEGYRFVVFDDSNDNAMTKCIAEECKKWQVEYVRVPQEIHLNKYVPRDPRWRNNASASFRHSDVIQYIADTMAFNHEGPVFLTDSDLFMVRPLNFHKATEEVDVYAVFFEAEVGIKYFWPGLAILRMDRLPNKRTMKFHCGSINNNIVDTGGNTYYYFKENPRVKRKEAPCLCGAQLFISNRYAKNKNPNVPVDQQIRQLKSLGFDDLEINFLQRKVPDISWALEHTFLHYNAASNYDKTQSKEYIKNKDKMMEQFIKEKLQSEV